VARLWRTFSAIPLAFLLLEMASDAGSLCPAAFAQQSASTGNKSWTESITSPFRQGFDKLGQALNPKKSPSQFEPEDDAISLKSQAKPKPELYVAVARLYEESGKLAEAEQQYQLALADKEQPNCLPALLGYARLKESLGKPNEAIQLYQRAAKAHPRQASVYNNLGMCYARQNRLDDAVAAISRAIEIDPENPLYRNNVATVLVDQNKLREAFAQLRKVHDPAAAYYNLGYLLNKKGQTQAAIQHFALALKADPAMDAARRWSEYLQKTQAGLSQHPAAAGAKVARQPVTPQEDAMMPPDELAPRRLPPTMLRQPASDDPTLPGISYDRSAAPSAPLPPPMNSAIRPLPRVN
jgi:tetratricopeptide (TPR) repeat protein